MLNKLKDFLFLDEEYDEKMKGVNRYFRWTFIFQLIMAASAACCLLDKFQGRKKKR
jgi:hypothetical protein